MAWIRTQVEQQYITNLPADVVVNTLHWTTPYPIDNIPARDAILVAINNAYGNIETYRSAYLKDTAGLTVKMYDVTAPPGTSPFYIGGPYNMSSPASATNLPLECAAVVSFRRQSTGGDIPARMRGRAYLGPFNVTALDDGDATTPPKLASGLITGLVNWATDLYAVGEGVQWAVYSRTDDAMYDVNDGWVDETWDTQRRRGNEPGARTPIEF